MIDQSLAEPVPSGKGKRNEAGACWRRGVMHAVESLDAVLRATPQSKRRAHEALAAVMAQLDALSDFARTTDPLTYQEASRASENRLALLSLALRDTPNAR
jgi:hypothetical protein